MLARRFLVACAALAAATPLAAQDHVWTDNRPDAVAPAGVVGDRTLPAGTLELKYAFSNTNFEGVRLGNQNVDPGSVLDYYDSTPFQRRDRMHRFVLAWGLSEAFTLVIDGHWADRDRWISDDNVFITTSASGMGDVNAEGLFSIFRGEAARAHLSLGAQIPVGSTDETGNLLVLQDQILPYEMQPGSGSLSIVPGLTASLQNPFGTVGAQVKARIRMNDNDRDYRLGNQVEARGWVGYRLNDYFGVTAGVLATAWGSIEGMPLDSDFGRDPGEDPVFSGGKQIDMPLGLNLYMPDGSLAGHRLSVEFVWPVHQDYDNFRVATDWSFVVGWQKTF